MRKQLLFFPFVLCLALILLAGSAQAAECTLYGDTITINNIGVDTSHIIVAGYDGQGKMVFSKPIDHIEDGRCTQKVDKDNVEIFKAFFLSETYTPLTEAKNVEEIATRVWAAEQICNCALFDIDLSQYGEVNHSFVDCDSLTDDEHKAVLAVCDKSIINAYPDGSFQPRGTITRAEAVKILCVALGYTNPPILASNYSDIQGHWAEPYISWLEGIGVLPDTDRFDPTSDVTKRDFLDWIEKLDAAISNCITEDGTYFISGDDTVIVTAPNVKLVGDYNGWIDSSCSGSILDLSDIRGKPYVYIMQDNTSIVGASVGTEITVGPSANGVIINGDSCSPNSDYIITDDSSVDSGEGNALKFPLHLYSYDGKAYLGKLVTNQYDSDGIWNPYGDYGSKYSSNSIWNPYGDYGSEYSSTSAFNQYSTTPPKIVDNDGFFCGYLTANKYLSDGYTIEQIRQLLINMNQ